MTSEDIIARGSFEYTERVPKSKRVYPSCEFPVAMLIIFMYVDNNGCRYNCRELLDEFLNDLKEDGRIDMNEEGKMENFLAVRYTQDPIIDAIERIPIPTTPSPQHVRAFASCAQEIAFIRKLSFELGFQQPGPTICQTDSKGAKLLVENGHFKGRSKHYELKWSFVCEYHDRGIMSIDWRPRATNVSDIGTSARPLEVFNRFVPVMLGEQTAATP